MWLATILTINFNKISTDRKYLKDLALFLIWEKLYCREKIVNITKILRLLKGKAQFWILCIYMKIYRALDGMPQHYFPR